MAELFESKPVPETPPNSPEPEFKEPEVPNKRRRVGRKKRNKSSTRGDSVHLQQWRAFFKEWVGRNESELDGVRITDRAKLAGIAYRHKNAKKRASDPATPEFL